MAVLSFPPASYSPAVICLLGNFLWYLLQLLVCEKWWVSRKTRLLMKSRFQAASIFLQRCKYYDLQSFLKNFQIRELQDSNFVLLIRFDLFSFHRISSGFLSSLLKPCRGFLCSIYNGIVDFWIGTVVHGGQTFKIPLQLTYNCFVFWIIQNQGSNICISLYLHIFLFVCNDVNFSVWYMSLLFQVFFEYLKHNVFCKACTTTYKLPIH